MQKRKKERMIVTLTERVGGEGSGWWYVGGGKLGGGPGVSAARLPYHKPPTKTYGLQPF